MKRIFFLLLILQTGIGLQSSFAQASNAKPNGIVPPSFTSVQRNDIASPTQGQLIFNVNDSCLNVYRGSTWVTLKTADVNSTSTQGNNAFNTPNQLIKLDASGNLIMPPPTLPSIPFTAPTLLNNWENYDATFAQAGYYKDVDGIVSLRGLIKFGVLTSNSIMFILPSGYRPSERLIFLVNNSDVVGRVDVLPTGEVVGVTGAGVFNNFASLSKINFRANGN
jgi:hypothetical protein